MRNLLRLSFVLVSLFILSACSNEFKEDYKLKVEPFSFTNQHEETVTLDDLKGDVWLAQFIFTNCTSVCGPMMYNMTALQDALVEEGVEDYKIVSFTVDPAVDDPAALQEYLGRFAPSDESKWEMLTGYKQEKIFDIARKSFASIVFDDPDSDQVTHTTHFILVNQDGVSVKLYDGNGTTDAPFEDNIDTIVNDMKALIKQGA